MKNQTIGTVARKGKKPFVARVDTPNGVRLIGVCAAAKWLGCSSHGLAAAAKGIPGRGNRLASMARMHFPELF